MLTSDQNLLNVLDAKMLYVVLLTEQTKTISSVVQSLARSCKGLSISSGEARTIDVNGETYDGRSSRKSCVSSKINTAVIIPKSSAEEDFDVEQKPTTLYVRATEGTVDSTSQALPVAINLGGPEGVVVAIPSDLLEAQGAVDTTLRNILFLMGGLALLVGGVGIANVMSISVIQRSGEIGIRRALGHTKVTIAMQFVLEALFVGVLGGLAGFSQV